MLKSQNEGVNSTIVTSGISFCAKTLRILTFPAKSTSFISRVKSQFVHKIVSVSQYHFQYCLTGTGVSYGWYWSFS